MDIVLLADFPEYAPRIANSPGVFEANPEIDHIRRSRAHEFHSLNNVLFRLILRLEYTGNYGALH